LQTLRRHDFCTESAISKDSQKKPYTNRHNRITPHADTVRAKSDNSLGPMSKNSTLYQYSESIERNEMHFAALFLYTVGDGE
jgi:hypothetical protein